jgi:hypothetical protein
MSVAFFESTVQNTPNVSIVPEDTGESEVFKKVQFYNGAVYNINQRQIPIKNPYRTNNVWRWPAEAFTPTLFRDGGQVIFKINRNSGSGHVKDFRLRIQWTNTSGFAVSYAPLPFMIQYLQINSPSGKLLQQFTGSDIWLALADNSTEQEWNAIADCIQASDDYGLGDVIPNGASGFWYLPVPGNLFEAAKFPTYLVDGDILIYVTFYSNQYTNVFYPAGTGNFGDLTVQAMSIDSMMVNQPQEELTMRMVSLSNGNGLAFIEPYIRIQTWTMTLNANSTYSLPLTGLKGDVVYTHVWIRDLVNGQLSARGFMDSQPIASFQWQNSAGQGISGQQFIEDVYNRRVQYPKWSPGQLPSNFDFVNYIYTTVFAEPDHAIISLLNQGYKAGAWPFTTNENFVFNTPGPGTNEVVKVTTTNNAATSGTFHITFFANGYGASSTPPLAYNSSLADIQNAIETLNLFQGNVNVYDYTGIGNENSTTWTPFTQATAGQANIYIQYAGAYDHLPMGARDYNFQFINETMVNGSGVLLDFSTSVTTPGVVGIASGNTFQITIYAWTTAIVTLDPKGQLDLINS